MIEESTPSPRIGQCASAFDSPEPLAGNYFVSTYPPFSCWSGQVTQRYLANLKRSDLAGVPLGLYIHVPFCTDRCSYCYYLSYDNRLSDMDRYLGALVEELRRYAEQPAFAGRAPSFVYFGGGTPSLLSTPRIQRLVSSLQGSFPWGEAREVTFECAPKSVTESKLQVLRDCGVTRISMGVQQLDDDILRTNGRVHLVEDVERAYAAIRRVGFDVVNVDLMIGLVGETDATYRASLERIIEMQPDSVTTYLLEVPLNTPLWRSIRDETLERPLASWEKKRERLRFGRERLELAGYSFASAYAAVRDPERHRFVYQTEQYHGADLLGIGASAFSHVGGFNQQNQTSIEDYVDRVTRGELPLSRAYQLSETERMVREFILQLKLGGVERAYFREKFGVDVVECFAEPIEELVRKAWLTVDAERVIVTGEGILRIDRLLPSFYLPEHRSVRYS